MDLDKAIQEWLKGKDIKRGKSKSTIIQSSDEEVLILFKSDAKREDWEIRG